MHGSGRQADRIRGDARIESHPIQKHAISRHRELEPAHDRSERRAINESGHRRARAADRHAARNALHSELSLKRTSTTAGAIIERVLNETALFRRLLGVTDVPRTHPSTKRFASTTPHCRCTRWRGSAASDHGWQFDGADTRHHLRAAVHSKFSAGVRGPQTHASNPGDRWARGRHAADRFHFGVRCRTLHNEIRCRRACWRAAG